MASSEYKFQQTLQRHWSYLQHTETRNTTLFFAAFSVLPQHMSAWVKNKTAVSHQTSKSQHPRFPLSAVDYRQWGMAWLFRSLHVCVVLLLNMSGARLVSIPPGWSPSRLGVGGDRNNLGGLFFGSRQAELNEWRVRAPTVRGNPRDMNKIGSAIFWKMCCWFDTLQVRLLFLRMSIQVDEDKLQVLSLKEPIARGDLRGVPLIFIQRRRL